MIDQCECDICVCYYNARADRGGVLLCWRCRQGKHRRDRRE